LSVLGVSHRSRWEELMMKTKLIPPGSVVRPPNIDRRPMPRSAVARRIDSKPPTRVWSLLLPPAFRPNGRG